MHQNFNTKAETAKADKFCNTASLNASFFLKVWLTEGGGDSV